MLLFIGKVILLYFTTIGVIRLMGKSAFAQLTAHDLAGIFFVISIAAGPLVTEKILYTITALAVVGVLHVTMSKLMLTNWMNRLFTGKPTIVIKHGKLIKPNLKRSHFTLAELLSEAREKGYPDITMIDYAIMETNGGISIIPSQKDAPVTPEQLSIDTNYQGIPLAVIIEGTIQHNNLRVINKDEQWLRRELDKAGYYHLKTIFYAAVRDNNYLLTVDTGEGRLDKPDDTN